METLRHGSIRLWQRSDLLEHVHFPIRHVAASPGVNAKADALANASFLPTKHKFVLKYLDHVRNAADHGTDSEIGQQWQISQSTSIEFVHVALTAIHDLIEHLNNRFVV